MSTLDCITPISANTHPANNLGFYRSSRNKYVVVRSRKKLYIFLTEMYECKNSKNGCQEKRCSWDDLYYNHERYCRVGLIEIENKHSSTISSSTKTTKKSQRDPMGDNGQNFLFSGYQEEDKMLRCISSPVR